MPDSSSRPAHHGRLGFKNPHNRDPHSGAAALRFLWDFQRQRWQRPAFPRAVPDVAWLAENRTQFAATWIGHSTFLVQVGGLNVLTDPHLTRRTSPLSWLGPERLAPLGLDFHELPRIDAVLVSHNHYDHLDLPTVLRLAREHAPRFYVPLGLAAWFRARGIDDVVELDWWQSATQAGASRGGAAQGGGAQAGRGAATITALPAQHFSGRTATDRNRTLWCGFLLSAGGRKVYFAGDTGYCPDFRVIGARHAPIDLALLPIGAYDPRDFMAPMHVDPDEAVRMHQDVGAVLSLAMHWGTFRLTLEPLDEPPRRLAAALGRAGVDPQAFRVLRHGETVRIG